MEQLNCLRCAYRHEDNGNCTAAGGFCTAVPAAKWVDGSDGAMAMEIVMTTPTADVAPVVRCRDCNHSYEDLGGLYCSFGPCVDCPVSPDFWCANGKRKEAT